jgi:HEAT repeat protein/cyclophilin family peptidyl-prolyl cis-trans isomerase
MMGWTARVAKAARGLASRAGLLSLAAPTLILVGCASAPPAAPIAKPAGPPFEQKMSWILRLEDQRVLRDPPAPTPPAEPPPPVAPRGKKLPAVAPPPPPPPPPDLVLMLGDSEARVRRRSALAIGRVGLADGVDPLLPLLLSDAEPEVRQMAAFALGLIGDRRAKEPLVAALADSSSLVQGSAAEALGLVGDPTAADAIGRFVSQAVHSPAFGQPPGEDDDARRDTPTAACRLGVFALVRLKAYPVLAAAVLDDRGQPVVRWWPIAYALQRLEDERAAPALLALAGDPNPYTRAFAVKGLGGLKDRAAMPILMPLIAGNDRAVQIEAIRAVGRIGDVRAAAALQTLIRARATDPAVRLEAVNAMGGLHATADAADQLPSTVVSQVIDLLTDSNPAIRASALRAIAALDPENLRVLLSGLDPDPHWSVRAALATMLGTLTAEEALPRLTAMLTDDDQRVIPSVLNALTKLKAPSASAVLLERLKSEDPAVRAAAATNLGELTPDGGPGALAEAYRFGERDSTYIARAAALATLSKYGPAAATASVKAALSDKDWAIRVRAAALMKELDPSSSAEIDMAIRPAPTTVSVGTYSALQLTNPPVSTTVFIDTDRGSIEIELAVLDAPLTTDNFIALARKGYFNGLGIHRVVPNFVVQDGDPRGDGEGGPGYTIRDELNQRPYLRGTVGMALDWKDTGGSQFFITHSPQPHLDAKYTVFGRVVSGADVVDKIQQWDVIRAVRVWDGERMTAR